MQGSPNSYDAVRFANRLWLDGIASWRNPQLAMLRISGLAALPYFLGGVLAAANGQLIRFLMTPGFFVGSLGLALTLGVISYGSHAQYQIFDRLLRCFALSKHERDEFTFRVLERHSNFRQHIRASFMIAAFGLLMLYFSQDHVNTVSPKGRIEIAFPHLSAFYEHGWYSDENIKLFNWIAGIYILCMAPALGTSSSIIIRMPKLLWDASRFQPAFPPALIKIHFTPAARFYATVSLSWLIGFALMFYLFFSNRDAMSLVILTTVLVTGLVNFIIPQLAYARTILRSEDQTLAQLTDLVASPDQDIAAEALLDGLDDEKKVKAELIMQMTQHAAWVYPLHQTYAISAIYLLSLVGSLTSKTNFSLQDIIGL